jgi:DNA-directed RNA polymerase subunit A'
MADEEAPVEKPMEEPSDESSESTEEKKELEPTEVGIFKQVKAIEFRMLSPKDIKKMAVAKVVTPELYDKEGYPVDGGLMDIRLGVIDPGLRCKTCGAKLKECPGHFGYMELARPIIHISHIATVLNLLKSTCRDCGRVLIPKIKIDKAKKEFARIDKEIGFSGRKAYMKKVLTSMKNANKCAHCSARQFKIALEKPTTFLENDKRISPIEIRMRLEKISDEDVEMFGINAETARPEWMVITIMPIPPVTMRPSITLESGERSEDDLTHKMGDIVRINQRLFENINAGAPEIIIEDLWDLLQYHITTFFDNSVAQLPPARHRSGQPLKTISERIKSKEGRIRHNLAGKRTNFSARTVISPDPMLALDEVGVPKIIAMKLSVPETITPWNMKYLKAFIERGPTKYPGCNYVIRPDGKKKKITDETKEAALEELQPGYVVERHLMDGDIAIFNRQPSLHRMSMMCHKVKVLPGKTFRLNPAVCHPYNADFDGDEMNLHIPQNEESRAEAETLMAIPTQLISPRYGLSIIGCTQDSISGNYLLTDSISMTRNEAVELLSNIGITNYKKLPQKQTVTGKEIFSVLIPSDFNYVGNSRQKENNEVVINNGQLTKGHIDANSIGQEAGLMLRDLHKQYGPAKTIKILENMFRLGNQVLLNYGFTTGLMDSDMPEDARAKIEETLTNAEKEVAELIKAYEEKVLDVFPGRSMQETLELKILEVLNKARNKTGQIVSQYAGENNASVVMAASGARGNPLNLIQMAACVGQQAMRGKRIDKGYKLRTLSHFKKNDLSPAARGFIRHGFKKGLAPHEFFFQAMTGRDSLMDTALRTPKSGYLYRRLANAMQDLKVEYDQTVRDASGKIIQFMYGEDGIDVSKSEKGTINVKKLIETTK